MNTLLKILLAIFIVGFICSGFFTLLGALFGMTFGLIGAVISLTWKIVTNPIILILVIIYLVYRQKKVSS